MPCPRRILLAALLLAVAAGANAKPVNALAGFYHKVHTLSAHFQQRQTDDSGHTLQRASGTFLLSRPDRFRWQYQKPYKQVIVSNGKSFKFYDVDLAQVTVRDIDSTLKATPALLLTGGAALRDAFDVRAAGHHDGLDWVALKPRAKDTDFKSVRLGLDDRVPAMMVLHDNLGQTTRIRFSDVKLNPEIAASRFTLDVPDNVEVVDGRAAPQGTRR